MFHPNPQWWNTRNGRNGWNALTSGDFQPVIAGVLVDELETIPEIRYTNATSGCAGEEERDGKPTKIPVTPGAGVRVIVMSRRPGEFRGKHLSATRDEHADGVGFRGLPTTIPSSALI